MCKNVKTVIMSVNTNVDKSFGRTKKKHVDAMEKLFCQTKSTILQRIFQFIEFATCEKMDNIT